MGHLPQSGPGGMMEVLDGVPGKRKILIHINNTNPILDEESAERRILDEHGIDFKDLQSSQSSLEEIFVSLVKGSRT